MRAWSRLLVAGLACVLMLLVGGWATISASAERSLVFRRLLRTAFGADRKRAIGRGRIELLLSQAVNLRGPRTGDANAFQLPMPVYVPRALKRVHNAILLGSLPSMVRDLYGLNYTKEDEARLDRVCEENARPS
jgi:hypothetical protein